LHFFISRASMSIFGTPNGHAYTQFRHAMQRDGSACWTTPSGVIRIAITGHTCAQGATGSSQCIHTVGWVATLIPRSTKSTMTMLSPLCESHSRQAASHARHPMQRAGSTNSV
jgi:hypothetical protein